MTSLETMLYKEYFIDFKALETSIIKLGFSDLPIHQKIIVRARVYNTCYLNRTILMTLKGEENSTTYVKETYFYVPDMVQG